MFTVTVPRTVRELLKNFRTCFTKPGFESFSTLITGWILCQGRHSISRVIQASLLDLPIPLAGTVDHRRGRRNVVSTAAALHAQGDHTDLG